MLYIFETQNPLYKKPGPPDWHAYVYIVLKHYTATLYLYDTVYSYMAIQYHHIGTDISCINRLAQATLSVLTLTSTQIHSTFFADATIPKKRTKNYPNSDPIQAHCQQMKYFMVMVVFPFQSSIKY